MNWMDALQADLEVIQTRGTSADRSGLQSYVRLIVELIELRSAPPNAPAVHQHAEREPEQSP